MNRVHYDNADFGFCFEKKAPSDFLAWGMKKREQSFLLYDLANVLDELCSPYGLFMVDEWGTIARMSGTCLCEKFADIMDRRVILRDKSEDCSGIELWIGDRRYDIVTISEQYERAYSAICEHGVSRDVLFRFLIIARKEVLL